MTDTTKSLNLYGLTPGPVSRKLFNVEGWQLAVGWQESEDDFDPRWELTLATDIAQYGGEVEVKVICNDENLIRTMFADYDDEKARSGLQFVLDNLIKAEAGDGFDLKVPTWIDLLRKG